MFARMLVTAITVTLSVCVAHAAPLSCADPIRFTGQAKTGNDFIHAARGLIFSLNATRNAPPNPHGWTIAISPLAAAQQVDLVWAANPPFRGLNVRDLTLSYGETAERVVAKNPRQFAFYTDTQSNAQAQSWIRQEPGAPAERPAPQGKGELRIDSYVFSTAGSTKIIASMKFHVTLCLTD